MEKERRKKRARMQKDAPRFLLRFGSPEEYAWLEEKARAEHLSVNSLLLRMVDDAIRKERKHGA